MKIINKTHWRTDDLNRILSRICREEKVDPAKRKRMTATISYTRGTNRNHYTRGYAWYHSHDFVLKVPKDEINLFYFCMVAAHEIAHTEGMHHVNMLRGGRYNTYNIDKIKEQWPWIADEQIRRKETPAKKVIPIQKVRYQRAKANLKKAETRFRRAKTLFSKWQKKVRYYEKTFEKAASIKE